MPPLPAVQNVIRLNAHYTIGSDTTTGSRWFFRYTGTAPDAAGLNAWCANVDSRWRTNCIALYGGNVSVTLWTAVDLSSANGAYGQFTSTAIGTRTGAAVSASTTVNCNYKINRRYRGGKPRTYFPFGTVPDMLTPQNWQNNFLGLCQAGVQGWFTDITTTQKPSSVTTLEHVNVSYYSKFDDNGHPITPGPPGWDVRPVPKVDPILGPQIQTPYGAQRKRVK